MGSHTQSGSEDTPGLFSADSKEPSIMTRTILLTFGLLTLVSTAPQNFGRNNRRGYNNNNSPNTKFFTNNRPLNDAIAGAAIGLGTQYVANNIFNPCRDRNRYNTNNRIFGANNGLLGFFGIRSWTDHQQCSGKPLWLRQGMTVLCH